MRILILVLASLGCANGTSTLVLDVGASGTVERVDHFRVTVTDLTRNLDSAPVDLPAHGATLPPSQRLEVRFAADVRGPMYVLVEARDDADKPLTSGSTQVEIEPSQTVTSPVVLGVVVPPMAVDGGLLDLWRPDLAGGDLAHGDLAGADLAGLDLAEGDLATAPVDPDQSTVSVSPGTSVVADGTSKFTVTVTVLSASGAPIAGAGVQLSTSAGAPAIAQPAPTDANGQTSGTITSTVPATYFVIANVGGTAIVQHPSITFVVGAAAKLVFAQPPVDTYAGTPFSPAVAVAVEDAQGNPVDSSAPITIALTSRPNSASLVGLATVNASGGTATFDPLGIDTAGAGYVITASASGLTSATATFGIKTSPWKSVSSGLEGGQVNQLAGTHDTVWAATSGGVFKSTDAGATWSPSGFGLAASAASSIAIDSAGTLYTSSNGAMYRSVDGGASWQRGMGAMDAWQIVTAGSGVAYAGGSAGVAKTVDGGLHWTTTSLGSGAQGYRALAVNPANPLIVYAASYNALQRSSDGGGTFAPVNGIPANGGLVSLYHTGTILYAIANAQLYQLTEGTNTLTPVSGTGIASARAVAGSAAAPSKIYVVGTDASAQFDGSSTWTPITGLSWTIQPTFLWPFPDDATSVLAGTLWHGVYARRAGGGSFAASAAGMHALQLFNNDSLAIADANTLYLGTSLGVFKTTNAGASWSLVTSIGAGSNSMTVAVNPSSTSSVYFGFGTSIYTSANGGTSWTQITNSQPPSVNALVVKPGAPTVWAGTLAGSGGPQAMISSGGGAFTSAATGLTDPNVWDLALDLSSANPTLFASTGTGIFRTTDATGSTWTPLAFSGQYVSTIALALTPASTDLLAGISGAIYHSHDYGVTWTQMSVPPGLFPSALAVRDFAKAAYATSTDSAGSAILRSVNGGSWSRVEANLRTLYISTRPVISPASDDTVFVGTGSGVYMTTTGGL